MNSADRKLLRSANRELASKTNQRRSGSPTLSEWASWPNRVPAPNAGGVQLSGKSQSRQEQERAQRAAAWAAKQETTAS